MIDYINITLYSIKIRLKTPDIFTTLASWLRTSAHPDNRILSIDRDIQSVHPVVEEFLQAAQALNQDLKSTVGSFTLFLESMEKMTEKALQTKGSSKDIGECMKHIFDEHRNLLKNLTSFSKSLDTDLIGSVQSQNAVLRKDVKSLDQTHWREMKNMRISIKTKKSEIKKLNKKAKRDQTLQQTKLKDEATSELHTMQMVLEEQERQALRRINLTERSFFSNFAACLQQVVQQELNIFSQHFNISQELLKLEQIIKTSDGLPPSSETLINELVSSGQGFIFITPPSSPRGSLLRSWGGSVMSIASLMDASTTSPKEKRRSRKKEKSNRLMEISEKEDTITEINSGNVDLNGFKPMDASIMSNMLQLDTNQDHHTLAEEEYFTRKSSLSSGYGSSSCSGKSDNSDDELKSLKVPSNEEIYFAPRRSSSVMSSFRAPIGHRVRTFSENMEDQDFNTRSRNNYHLSRSSSFGGHYKTEQATPIFDQTRTQTIKPRRNSEIVTNLHDHIRLLDQQKDSIMNFEDRDYWI